MLVLEKAKKILGNNYVEETDEVLQYIIDEVTPIACDISNRAKEDEKLDPYIIKAVRSEYLSRGAEGLLSKSEGSQSSSFEDIIDKMRTNIVKNGVRRVK